MRRLTALICARVAFASISAIAATLMLAKPLQGLEQVFGLGDKAAHTIVFYALTVGLYVTLPERRRGDLTLFAITAALAIELLQGLTGRSVSLSDFFAGAIGSTAAWVPGAAEEIRRKLRGEADRRAISLSQPIDLPLKNWTDLS